VRGSRSTSSRTFQHGEGADPAKVAAAPVGTYPSAPVLAACRQVGKGRIVVLGITPEYLIDEPATRALDRVVYDKGLKGVKSDGAALVVNSLRWLAEPSTALDGFGGAAMDVALTADPRIPRLKGFVPLAASVAELTSALLSVAVRRWAPVNVA